MNELFPGGRTRNEINSQSSTGSHTSNSCLLVSDLQISISTALLWVILLTKVVHMQIKIRGIMLPELTSIS